MSTSPPSRGALPIRPGAGRVWVRRIVALVALAAAVTAGVLLITGASEPAPAPPVADDGAASNELDVARLPPFGMVLGHKLAPDLVDLAPALQAEELRTRAMSTNSPERLVELGSVLQLLGDTQSADFAYASALEADPGHVPAEVGIAMVTGASGPEGLAAAAAALRALATANPQNQLVSFNQAWVELYRGRSRAARTELQRTISLGQATLLGRTAAGLDQALGTVRLRTPAP